MAEGISPTPVPPLVLQTDTPSVSASPLPAATQTLVEGEPESTAVIPDTNFEPTPTSTQATAPNTDVTCTALQNLNVRSGPGKAYDPPLTSIVSSTTLLPLGFRAEGIPGGPWLFVQLPDGSKGWVSAGANFVSCTIDITSLPDVVAAAPPATQAPPTNQPPAPPVLSNPSANGNCPEVMRCDLQFSNSFFYRLVLSKIDSNEDGIGVFKVTFKVSDVDKTVSYYEYTDIDAAFCLFGGDAGAIPGR